MQEYISITQGIELIANEEYKEIYSSISKSRKEPISMKSYCTDITLLKDAIKFYGKKVKDNNSTKFIANNNYSQVKSDFLQYLGKDYGRYSIRNNYNYKEIMNPGVNYDTLWDDLYNKPEYIELSFKYKEIVDYVKTIKQDLKTHPEGGISLSISPIERKLI